MTYKLLILSWHQSYLKNYAGGYIRLQEFLKRFPPAILLDNKPSIYKDILPKTVELRQYQTPGFLTIFQKRFFIFWYLSETISAMIILYRLGKKIIGENKIKIIYVPIGEFYHLYLAGVLLKIRFPKIKLVVDILNYEIQAKNIFAYFSKLRKNGNSFFRAAAVVADGLISILVKKITFDKCDYIFTVSPHLVEVIKRDYKKNTIDFTPSGVRVPTNIPSIKNKKYLGVYIGRMNVEKGVENVIITWSMVCKKLPKAKLALAGVINPDFLNYLKRRIKEFGLVNNIDLFGPVSENLKQKILSQSELFLHLAHYEPLFPVIGILEGLAAGLPTIIYEMPVVTQFKKENKVVKTLFIVKNGSTELAARKVIDYMNFADNEKLNYSLESINLAKNFDWKTIAQKEINVLINYI